MCSDRKDLEHCLQRKKTDREISLLAAEVVLFRKDQALIEHAVGHVS